MNEFYTKLKAELNKNIVGKDEVFEYLLIAVLCEGHVLLEGLPGTAKTTIVNSFAKVFNASFKRIQFTPDLLPSDILGTYVFNQKTTNFEFRPGPIFSNFILADEINRSPPKTQSALLECMGEHQVTLSGDTYKLSPPFIVIATQNPIEMEGTYPLPEAELDRFLFKIPINYPLKNDEFTMLKIKDKNMTDTKTLFSVDNLLQLKKLAANVYVDDQILVYIVNILEQTRQNPQLLWGAGPRASIALLQAAKARALIYGRDFVLPDDVKELTYPILRHRIKTQESETNSIVIDQLIWAMLKNVPIPKINYRK